MYIIVSMWGNPYGCCPAPGHPSGGFSWYPPHGDLFPAPDRPWKIFLFNILEMVLKLQLSTTLSTNAIVEGRVCLRR